ncbi:diaminopimelate epimerase [Desulfopila inferna]|uniref:diaminopimelate epimerase n=1 Tax=Desulfopila inferna TaxID=468528 RepID=UPI0019651235|nr:diaminopimelate epimerase [Desulfopila inferna]MBM9604096.1 diaminopimelate epimerase [Desulfopila inferna]
MENIFPIAFTKMNGTGNDFLIIDHRDGVIPVDRQAEFAGRVCRRMFSVGADGLILIEDSDKADFRWRFYNSDGSMPEMCGNGARCAARFAYRTGIAGRNMRFETLAGIIEAEICADEDVRIRMTDPFGLQDDFSLNIGGREMAASFVNTGVPHAVLFVDNDDAPVREWGPEVRFHPMFQPDGTNANFVTIRGPGEILARTYERGVEDETRACGTGAVAAAIIASIKKHVVSPVVVVTSGGDRLTIEFELRNGTRAENVYLKGPARIVYRGELTAEALL